jgi:hypothetical protein
VSNKSDPGGLSYHRQAQIDQDLELGGRFAKEEINSGAEAAVPYPRLPAGSPWAGAGVGVERPLGYSIQDLEPTGEAFEIERSLVLAALVGGEKKAEVAPALAVSSPADVVETPRPISSAIKRRKKF